MEEAKLKEQAEVIKDRVIIIRCGNSVYDDAIENLEFEGQRTLIDSDINFIDTPLSKTGKE